MLQRYRYKKRLSDDKPCKAFNTSGLLLTLSLLTTETGDAPASPLLSDVVKRSEDTRKQEACLQSHKALVIRAQRI